MVKILIIGAGGFLGAVARYSLSGLVHRFTGASFPYGTLTVNVLGCFLLGGLMYCVQERAVLSPAVRPFLAIGVAGAFTTFSTFGYETLELIEDRELAAALANVGTNVCLGLGAVWLGRTVLRAAGL